MMLQWLQRWEMEAPSSRILQPDLGPLPFSTSSAEQHHCDAARCERCIGLATDEAQHSPEQPSSAALRQMELAIILCM